MKFVEHGITLLEIPDEISLYFTISGCPLRCDGCHSAYLRNPKYGEELTDTIILDMINRYKGYITNVLFMGGEWELERLLYLLTLVSKYGLKTSLYTGEDVVDKRLSSAIDYLKTGPYVKSLGGLYENTTNQILRDMRSDEIINHKFIGR